MANTRHVPANVGGGGVKHAFAPYNLFLIFFMSNRYEVQILEVAGALTRDSFKTISFPQGEGPHVQLPTALLRVIIVHL